MFEALEMLALGIQGKRLLWSMHAEIAPRYPEWSETHSAEPELRAIRQLDEFEARRLQAGLDFLSDARHRP